MSFLVTQINYSQSLLFYDALAGEGEIYRIKQDGNIGDWLEFSSNNWRKTWTEIEFVAGTKKTAMLFYQSSNGFAESYEIKKPGKIGGSRYSSNDWRNTWTDIEYYSQYGRSPSERLVFYDDSGYAEIYSIKPDGSVGQRLGSSRNRWIPSTTELELYAIGTKGMALFYNSKEKRAEVFAFSSNDGIGEKLYTWDEWDKEWTDIEYYQRGDGHYLFLYEAKSGSAEIYGLTVDGDLSELLFSKEGMRKTWTSVDFFLPPIRTDIVPVIGGGAGSGRIVLGSGSSSNPDTSPNYSYTCTRQSDTKVTFKISGSNFPPGSTLTVNPTSNGTTGEGQGATLCGGDIPSSEKLKYLIVKSDGTIEDTISYSSTCILGCSIGIIISSSVFYIKGPEKQNYCKC